MMRHIIFNWDQTLAADRSTDLLPDVADLLRDLQTSGHEIYVITARLGDDPTQDILNSLKNLGINMADENVMWVRAAASQSLWAIAQRKADKVVEIKENKHLTNHDMLYIDARQCMVDAVQNRGVTSLVVPEPCFIGGTFSIPVRKTFFDSIKTFANKPSDVNNPNKEGNLFEWGLVSTAIGVTVVMVAIIVFVFAAPGAIVVTPLIALAALGMAVGFTALSGLFGVASCALKNWQHAKNDAPVAAVIPPITVPSVPSTTSLMQEHLRDDVEARISERGGAERSEPDILSTAKDLLHIQILRCAQDDDTKSCAQDNTKRTCSK